MLLAIFVSGVMGMGRTHKLVFFSKIKANARAVPVYQTEPGRKGINARKNPFFELSLWQSVPKSMNSTPTLTGKVALITGGSKGIGFGIGMALAAQGMRVALTSRSLDAAKAAALEINRSYPRQALGLAADVRDLVSQEQAVAQLLATWGQLDVLVANAGVGHFANIETITVEQWQETIDTNLTGVFYSIKACLSALKASQGYIITMASLAGANFFPGGSAYNASKFGLVGFSQAIMLDLRDAGIKTTTIMPGSVSTYFNDRVPSDADAWKIQPEDLGQMVVDLLRMPPRTLPSKIEVRPSQPPQR